MDNQYKIIELKFDQAQQPKFEEKRGKGYIEFGKENDYPTYLLGLFNESAKHGAIIKGKCNYIFGKGFENKELVNSRGENWNDILKRCVKDDELYRGYYLQIIWNRAKKVAEIYHIEFAKVRVSKDLTNFYVKDDWKDNKEEARCYEAFNLNKPVGSQILYIKEYNPASKYYPLPTYFQGLNYIESDIEVSRHILGNAKQGFVGSTLINLNNGDPIGEEHKGEVERGLLKKFTGSEGRRLVIMFNKSKENSADIQDLGNSMLTKEDFTNINNLIQQEIFASHQVTSPTLFGISTPGSMGQRNEIRDAYEIFSNTYVNERQQEFENVFGKLMKLKGQTEEYKIIPVEPLKFEFGESTIVANLTQDEIREIMGKEPMEKGSVTSDGTQATNDSEQTEKVPMQSNEAIKNLTGRQYQNVMRVVRQFSSGKLTKAQASLLLQSGYGFTELDINTFLGIEEDSKPNSFIQAFFLDEDSRMYNEFEKLGDQLEDFNTISSSGLSENFADDKSLSQLESNVLKIIKDNPKVKNDAIAEVLKIDLKVVQNVIAELLDAKVIEIKEVKIGEDVTEEIEIIEPPKDITIEPPSISEFFIRYTYEWRDIVPFDERNTDAHPSRPFCIKMMELSASKTKKDGKTWSMTDIQNISTRLGYSVLDRCGGWWNDEINKKPYQCRHQWVANVVTRKKQK